MATINKINLNSIEYDIVGSSYYGICSTAGNTAAKTVVATTNKLSSLYNGLTVTIKFVYANLANNPTLKVDDTEAKAIYYNNVSISPELI